MSPTSTLSPLGKEETTHSDDGPDTPQTGGDNGAVDAGAGETLSRDELFHLLQNSRRRAVLRCLRGREGPVRMRDVAEQVAAWEHDTTVAQLSSEERQRVYIALYQSHLETLEDAGVIAYNKPRGIVEPRPLLDHVASYTDRPVPSDGTGTGDAEDEGPTGGSDTRWDRGYLGLSVAGALLLVGTAADLTVLGTLSGFAASALILTAFTLLTLAKLALDGEPRTESA